MNKRLDAAILFLQWIYCLVWRIIHHILFNCFFSRLSNYEKIHKQLGWVYMVNDC